MIRRPPVSTRTEPLFPYTPLFRSHYLLMHPSVLGALQTLVMFLAVWWAWIYTAWAVNWIDPDLPPVRLVLAIIMLLSLVLSSAIPGIFGRYGLYFALAYVAIQVGGTAYTAWDKGERQAGASRNQTRPEGRG